MAWLSLLLVFKIGSTAITAAGPTLLAAPSRIRAVLGIVSNTGTTALLLGTGAWRKTPVAAPVFGVIARGLVAAAMAPAALPAPAW